MQTIGLKQLKLRRHRFIELNVVNDARQYRARALKPKLKFDSKRSNESLSYVSFNLDTNSLPRQ